MEQIFYRFRADTFDEAYQFMVDELGKSAVVVNTKEVVEGGLLGFLGTRKIEVTATVPAAEPEKPASARKLSLPEKKYEASAAISEKTFDDTVAFFRKVVNEAQSRMAKEEELPASAPPTASPPPLPPTGKPALLDKDMKLENLQEEMRHMRALLQVLVAENSGGGSVPAEFSAWYRNLVDAGTCRTLAAALVAATTQGSDPKIIRNSRVFQERLKVEIQKRITVTGGIRLTRRKRHTVALVGATGVGKTTNLAKLAAQFSVQHRARVGLITTDTYRVAAPEQLRVYANIIGLPMLIANDAAELLRGLKEFEDYDLVMIDTVGGSQFNLDQIRELQAILDPARLDEVTLVLSANTQLTELRSAVKNFGCLVPTSLLFSKLDETQYFGALLTVAAESGLPLGYFSTGQNVPNDIELASPGKVVKLLFSEGGRPVGSGA